MVAFEEVRERSDGCLKDSVLEEEGGETRTSERDRVEKLSSHCLSNDKRADIRETSPSSGTSSKRSTADEPKLSF